jgi:large subunit ribosomal protein L25
VKGNTTGKILCKNQERKNPAMEQVTIAGALRKGTGKGVARALRRSGNIPAVFYGPETDPLPLQVAKRSFEKILKSQTSDNVLYRLTFPGDQGETVKTVMVKDIQRHPITREILHVDFYEVSMTKPLDVLVAIKVTGKSPGVEKGGILQEASRELEIRCLPGAIPEYIEVDVSGLDIGDSIHLKDLSLPEGVRVLSDPQTTLVTIVPPTEEKAVEEAPAQEGEVEVTAKKGKGKEEAEG